MNNTFYNINYYSGILRRRTRSTTERMRDRVRSKLSIKRTSLSDGQIIFAAMVQCNKMKLDIFIMKVIH